MVHKKSKKQRQKVDTYKLNVEAHEKSIQEGLVFGKPHEKKTDDELFTFDKKGAEKKEKKIILSKSDRILAPNPLVEAISTVDHPPSEIKKNKILERRVTKQTKSKKDNVIAKYNLLQSQQQKKKKPIISDGGKRKFNDIWDTPQKDEEEIRIKVQKVDNRGFIDEHVAIVKNKPTNTRPLAPEIKLVPIPEPGLSYNPDTEEHQDVLAMEKAKQIRELSSLKYDNINSRDPEIIKELQKPERPLSKTEAEAMKMRLKKRDQEEANKPKELYQFEKQERITRKEKNRKQRRVESQNLVRQKVQQEKFNKEIDNATKYLDDIIQAEKQIEFDRNILKQKIENTKGAITQKIGKNAVGILYEPVLNNTPKSLKDLHNPSYNPLKERYMMLQKKNIIEGSGRKGEPKKGRTQTFIRASYHNTTPL